MKVGIWKGSTPERVHVDDSGRPLCRARSPGSDWIVWPGSLREVTCRRCLINIKAHARRRLAGKDGIQSDAFERGRR